MQGTRKKSKVTPVRRTEVHLAAKQTCEEAFGQICRSATDQIVKNRSVILENDDPEGPHQMRVGLRRLRSALKAFRHVVDDKIIHQLSREARQLGLVLSELRDVDVLVSEIVATVTAKHPDNPDLKSLAKALTVVQVKRRAKVRSVLRSEQWAHLRQELDVLPKHIDLVSQNDQDGALSQPIFRASHKALRRLWRRVAERGERIEKLNMPERHEMRKDLKTLRYALDFFAPLYPAKEVKPYLKHLSRLQDIFGHLIDIAVAQKLPTLVPHEFGKDPAVHRAIGFVNGWHAARAEVEWQDAQAAWNHLAKSQPFWLR